MSEMQKAAPGKAKASPEAPPEVRPEVAAAVKLRCPYCQDTCSPVGSVACQDCLTRHHADCWQEQGACSSCGSQSRLVAEVAAPTDDELVAMLRAGDPDAVLAHYEQQGLSAEEAQAKASALAFAELERLGPASTTGFAASLFRFQGGLLAVLALCALLRVDIAVFSTAGVLVFAALALVINRAVSGRAALKPLLNHLAMGTSGLVLGFSMINAWHIGPADRSPPLMLLGMVMAAISLWWSRRRR